MSRSSLRAGFVFAFLGVAIFVTAQTVTLELPSGITTVDAFIEYRDANADSPEGGAAVFLLSMLLWETDPALGHDAMVIALDASELRAHAEGYRGFTLGNRATDFTSRYLVPRPFLARSYLVGTSPGNGYHAPGLWTIELSRNPSSVISEDRVKVFVTSTGADSSRPITLQRNNRGVWKAYEFSSLFVGIRPPQEEEDDPL